jgi:hypothetical protein
MDELTVLRDLGPATDPGTASARLVARAALDRRIADRRSWLRRPLAVGITTASAAVMAGGAFALSQYVFVGSPASQAVERQVEQIDGVKATLRSHARTTGVLVDQTKAAVVLDTVAGPAYLWVAPTRGGGYCQYLDLANGTQPGGGPNLTGGCTTGHPFALDASFPWTRVGEKTVALVYGYVQQPATTVQIHFQSGATKSADINDGYFMVEVPAGDGPGSADQVTSVDALTSNGTVVATQVKGRIAPTARS